MRSLRWLLPSVCGLVLACSRGKESGDSVGDSGGAASSPRGGSTSLPEGGASGGASTMAGATQTGAAVGGGAAVVLPNGTSSGTFVHLFEWRWADVALECERYLGPKGFTAVQVSPPNEHAKLPGYAFPWWQRYQPVSYELESRSGSRAEFIDMVARCRAAGVGIYVDAVLNHMTAQISGVGSGGTAYSKYDYPGVYAKEDFHAPCAIESDDYAFSARDVQQCELLGLSDLDTASAVVRARLAAYLSELLSLGVRGFRLDAAKHMAPADIASILAQVTPRPDEKPYYFLEVIDYGGEAVHATDYLSVGGDVELDVTEFKYRGVGDAFLGRAGEGVASLQALGEQAWGLLPSERAVAFIDNHDTQRADASYYLDGDAHELATLFMLAWPYGYPSLMSSYAFDRRQESGKSVGPPSKGAGATTPVYEPGASEPSCVVAPVGPTSSGWVCEHRSPRVAAMVAFRKATAGAPVTDVWTEGRGRLAFSRGDKGFVLFNQDAAAFRGELDTGLPAGRYCDVLSGDDSAEFCPGTVVEVSDTGRAALVVAAGSALALHVGKSR